MNKKLKMGLMLTGGLLVAIITFFAVGIIILHYESKQPRIDFRFCSRLDYTFLCEWHFPATNGVPKTRLACYATISSTPIQCYQIEESHVSAYHPVYEHNDSYFRIPWTPVLEWTSVEPDRSAGYVMVRARLNGDAIKELVFPLDNVPPELASLRTTVENCMADPAMREDHAFFLRADPVAFPERPNDVTVMKRSDPFIVNKFHYRTHKVLHFFHDVGQALIPVDEGTNPFKGFKKPLRAGNSLTVNYLYDGFPNNYLNQGDNFWQVNVYGGTAHNNETSPKRNNP